VTSSNSSASPKTTVFLLGVATVVAQALLLREAMAAMGGSEMAWGTVMALWLLGVGLGSRIGAATGSVRLAHVLPVAVLTAAGWGVLLFRAAPALTGVASGETLTTASAAWLWIAAILPAAVAGGIAFPILAGLLGRGGGGRAYAIEAAGALAGGTLLSIALIGSGTTVALCLVLAATAAATLWGFSRTIAVIVALALAALAVPAANLLARAAWHWSNHPGTLADWSETRLQRLEVSDGPPITVYADGRLLASYPDPYVILPQAHLTMLLHPDPRRVLAVGCSADGSVEAMVRHPVDELLVVEEDPVLLRRLPSWYGPEMARVLSQPPVRAVISDPMRALARYGPWDVIVLRDGNPTTLRRNRTRTLEFFRRCRAHLRPNGIVILRVAIPDTYLGGAGGRLAATLAATVREAFPELDVIPGEEILIVATGPEGEIDLDEEILADRLRERGLENSELVPEMIPLLIDRDRAVTVLEHLAVSASVNTIRHPRAVLLAGGLHEARARPALVRLVLEAERRGAWPLAAVLAGCVLMLLARSLVRRPPVVPTAAAVGLCSMGWWLLLIATWQATRGSVYSEVGALTAVFMAGLAGGAAFASRSARPARLLPIILAAGGMLSLLIAGGIAIRFPLFVVPMFLASGGAMTGAAFPGLTTLYRLDVRRGTGIAFAADELGAALGAVAVGIFAIPWAGLTATALGLAILELAAIPAVLASRRWL
jgi:hypothetical protein